MQKIINDMYLNNLPNTIYDYKKAAIEDMEELVRMWICL